MNSYNATSVTNYVLIISNNYLLLLECEKKIGGVAADRKLSEMYKI